MCSVIDVLKYVMSVVLKVSMLTLQMTVYMKLHPIISSNCTIKLENLTVLRCEAMTQRLRYQTLYVP